MKGVSIIVPTFNRPDMVRESLESMKAKRTYPVTEVILVDGGSDPKHLPAYNDMLAEELVLGTVLLPHKEKVTPRDAIKGLGDSLLAGLDASNPGYEYVFFAADDLLYRTGWIEIMMGMLESDWAQRENMKITNGCNHWADPDDGAELKQWSPELYWVDGKIEGYIAPWGSNYFVRKDFFNEIGRFENNLKTHKVPQQYAHSWEAVMQYKAKELGWRWGCTRETYVQQNAKPGASMIGNYRLDDDGNPINNKKYKHGIAIGMAWKDE